MSAEATTAPAAPGSTPASTPRAAATWRQVAAQTRMELRLLTRNGESLLVTLGIPLGILVFFSTVDVLPTGDTEPVTFLVPGVLAISVMSTGLVAVAIVPHAVFWVDFLVRERAVAEASGALQWWLVGLGSLLGPLLSVRVLRAIGSSASLTLAYLLTGAGLALGSALVRPGSGPRWNLCPGSALSQPHLGLTRP